MLICARYLGKTLPYPSNDTAKSAAHALMTSEVDICNSLLACPPASTLKPVQRVLTITPCVVLRSPKLTHARTMLNSIQWLPVGSRVQFKVMLLLYNAINVFISYFKELVQP